MTSRSYKLPFRPSGMQRAALCPPSVWREARMPEMPNTEIRDEGTDLHSRIEGAYRNGDYSNLDDWQRSGVKACVGLIEKHAIGVPPEAILFEHELENVNRWGEPVYDRPAHIDCLIFNAPGEAIILDWKFGYLEPAFAASRDLQGLSYALAVRNNYEGIRKLTFTRFHPRLWDEKRISTVVYEGDENYWAEMDEVIKRIVNASREDAPAAPGHGQCLYCRAKSTCAEFIAWATPQMNIQAMGELTPDRLAGVLKHRPRVELLKKMMDDAVELARQAIESGQQIPGFELKEGRNKRSIEDTSAARRLLLEHMPAEAIDSATSISVTELERAFKAATGLKGRGAEEKLAGILNGLVTHKRDRPSLKQIGE